MDILFAEFEKAEKTILNYGEDLEKQGVESPTINKNARYQLDRAFAESLRKYAKILSDVPSDCPSINIINAYSSVLKEYANAIEKKWVFAGNELKEITDSETVSGVFEPIGNDYENKIRSICGACRIKHESEK